MLGDVYVLANWHNLYSDLHNFTFDADATWLWLVFRWGFAVKMPHGPCIHGCQMQRVEAPTAGLVILAGVCRKWVVMVLRHCRCSLLLQLNRLAFALSVIAIIYTSLVALAQEDMKKLIAYSSVAHMGYVTMGIFSLNEQGVQGAVFQMLAWLDFRRFVPVCRGCL